MTQLFVSQLDMGLTVLFDLFVSLCCCSKKSRGGRLRSRITFAISPLARVIDVAPSNWKWWRNIRGQREAMQEPRHLCTWVTAFLWISSELDLKETQLTGSHMSWAWILLREAEEATKSLQKTSTQFSASTWLLTKVYNPVSGDSIICSALIDPLYALEHIHALGTSTYT